MLRLVIGWGWTLNKDSKLFTEVNGTGKNVNRDSRYNLSIIRIIGKAGKDIVLRPKDSSGKQLYGKVSKSDSTEIN